MRQEQQATTDNRGNSGGGGVGPLGGGNGSAGIRGGGPGGGPMMNMNNMNMGGGHNDYPPNANHHHRHPYDYHHQSHHHNNGHGYPNQYSQHSHRNAAMNHMNHNYPLNAYDNQRRPPLHPQQHYPHHLHHHPSSYPPQHPHPFHPSSYPPQQQYYQHDNNLNQLHPNHPPNQFPTNHNPNSKPTHFQKCTPLTNSISHYQRLSQIGEGTYGQVYSAKSIFTHEIVALKKIRLAPKEESGLPRNVIREIKILKKLHHENMVKMIEVVSSKGYEYLDEEDERKDEKKKRLKLLEQKQQQQQEKENDNNSNSTITSTNNNNDNNDSNNNNKINTTSTITNYKGNLFLVLEYISHDLSGILDMGHRFTPVQSKYIFKQLLSVLQYMHGQNYVHRDLKSSNILLQSDFKVKLADFGLARCMSTANNNNGSISIEEQLYGSSYGSNDNATDARYTNKVVTLWYRSPELLLGSVGYNAMIDIWSAGCILAELLLGKALFPGKDELDQLKLIFNLMGTPKEDTWEALRETKTENNLEIKATRDIVPNIEYKGEFDNKYGNDERLESSPGAKMLITRLLEMNPKRRWSAEKALDSLYFRSKPIIPQDVKELGSLPDFGDSHEFQTKPIRKKAKLVAQQASKKAKVAGENEKEAWEKAYTEYLAQAAKRRAAGLPFDIDEEKGVGGDENDSNKDNDESSRKRSRDVDTDRRRSKDRSSRDHSERERKRYSSYDDADEDNDDRPKSSKNRKGSSSHFDNDKKHSKEESDQNLKTDSEDHSKRSSKRDREDGSSSRRDTKERKGNEKNERKRSRSRDRISEKDKEFDKSKDEGTDNNHERGRDRKKRDRSQDRSSRSRSRGRSRRDRKSSRDSKEKDKRESRDRDGNDEEGSRDDRRQSSKDKGGHGEREKRSKTSSKDRDTSSKRDSKERSKKSRSSRDKSSKERRRSREIDSHRYDENMRQNGWNGPPGPWENFHDGFGPGGYWDPLFGPPPHGGPPPPRGRRGRY